MQVGTIGEDMQLWFGRHVPFLATERGTSNPVTLIVVRVVRLADAILLVQSPFRRGVAPD